MKKILRSRNLRDADILRIVEILDGWKGKLTWELLVEQITVSLMQKYTRQALHKHVRIAAAYRLTQQRLRSSRPDGGPPRSAELQAALDTLGRERTKNERLIAENDALLEQFARWVYNARAANIDLDRERLNRPLPPINRRKSKISEL